MKRSVFLVSLLFLLLVSPVWAANSPTDEVRQIVDEVLKVLNRTDIDYTAKREAVSGTVQSHINIQSISQRTLGIHWKKATSQQQQQFSKLFVQILERTYLNRIENYSGGSVDYLNERVRDDKAIVDTQLVTANKTIPIQYKMVKKGDEWQIYDVLIEKVSLVRTYRDSYGDIVTKEGFEGLFAKLEEKLAEPLGTATN